MLKLQLFKPQPLQETVSCPDLFWWFNFTTQESHRHRKSISDSTAC